MISNKNLKRVLISLLIVVSSTGLIADNGDEISKEMFTINNIWMLISVFLVFIMHLGFATLETGLTRPKNAVNILFKNTAIVAIGFLSYALIGFALMYPGNSWIFGKFLGCTTLGLNCPEGAAGGINYAKGAYTYWTDFIFQGMFAATAATIISGAVAERVKLSTFLVFSTIYIAFVYPLIGSWGWGGGWLSELDIPFHDFAGSTFVHSVGGWGALAGILFLGPRLGKYVNGHIKPIMGHNMPLATIGVFLLWLGWFGFNGGSVLSADPMLVSYVFVTTFIAGCAGIIGAMVTSWNIQKKPDLSMVLNGCLAGLVGITAGADVVTITSAILIGLIAGVLVVCSVIFFDKLKLDDPVGALSVHLVCGIFGTLAVGIFPLTKGSNVAFSSQLIGVIVPGLFCFSIASLIFFILKKTMGLRVTEDEEKRGLDIEEHGMEAYPGFQIFTNM